MHASLLSAVVTSVLTLTVIGCSADSPTSEASADEASADKATDRVSGDSDDGTSTTAADVPADDSPSVAREPDKSRDDDVSPTRPHEVDDSETIGTSSRSLPTSSTTERVPAR